MPQSNKEFYTKWFAAQVHGYEKSTLGWVFWTWKTGLGDDYRWSYRGKTGFNSRLECAIANLEPDAVRAGVIPKDLNPLQNVC